MRKRAHIFVGLVAQGDPRDGIVFWGQPGAYPRPLFRIRPGASGPLSDLAARAGADNYYVEPTGYWREVGRFRAEVSGSSVRVFMTGRGVSHVILVWHYDA